jgi:hypothetical protein
MNDNKYDIFTFIESSILVFVVSGNKIELDEWCDTCIMAHHVWSLRSCFSSRSVSIDIFIKHYFIERRNRMAKPFYKKLPIVLGVMYI